MLKYQVFLLKQDDVELKITTVLNPAMFLESVPECQEALQHYCLLTIEQVYYSREGLRDTPVEDSDWELLTDGRSFVCEGKWKCGHAVMIQTEVTEVYLLPPLHKKLS